MFTTCEAEARMFVIQNPAPPGSRSPAGASMATMTERRHNERFI
jgi:hypothetical protein